MICHAETMMTFTQNTIFRNFAVPAGVSRLTSLSSSDDHRPTMVRGSPKPVFRLPSDDRTRNFSTRTDAMAAFVDVEGEQIETEEGLRRWINLAERYVASKPVKG